MNNKKEYIKENIPIINKMIDAKRPKSEIARILNVKYETLNKYLKELGVKYDGNPNRKGIEHVESRTDINKYLTNKKTISASTLRKKLIENGIKEEKCEYCGRYEWMGRKIPLELHHINMNHYDNRIENIQILCSNCHSIAHNYCNTKKPKKVNPLVNSIKKEKKNYSICKKTIKPKSQKYCSYSCTNEDCKKFTPSEEELINKFKELGSYVQVGKFYGVSDNAIRKRCKREGIFNEISVYIIHKRDKIKNK